MKTLPTLKPNQRLALPVVALTVAVMGIIPWKLTAREARDESAVSGGANVSTLKQRAQSELNLKNILLAIHSFHSTNQGLPRVATMKGDSRLLSWRVSLLPFLDQEELYKQFHHGEPWDSPHNSKLIDKMPDVFVSAGMTAENGKTTFLGFEGEDTLFPTSARIAFGDVLDGISNTIAVVETNRESAVIWTKPDELTLSDQDVLKRINGQYTGGFLVAFADGRVQFLSSKTSVDTLESLVRRSDGRAINDKVDQSFDVELPPTDNSDPRASVERNHACTVVIDDAIVMIHPHPSFLTKYLQATITAMQETGHEKFALRASAFAAENQADAKSWFTIRVVKNTAEIAAAPSLHYKYIVNVITHLSSDAGIRKVRFVANRRGQDRRR